MNFVNSTKRRGYYPPAPRKPCPLDPALQAFVRFKGTVDLCGSNFLGPEGLVGSGGGGGITGTEK